MTVTTINANVDSIEGVASYNTTYAIARAGSGGKINTADLWVGQRYFSGGNHICDQGFLAFDTSGIPDTDEVTAVELWLYPINNTNSNPFDVEVRLKDWGTTVETTDFVAGSELGGLTLVAKQNSSNLPPNDPRLFISEPAFLTGINKTGLTRVIFNSSHQREGNPATGTGENIQVYPNQTSLVITHGPAAAPVEEVTANLPVTITLTGELTEVSVVPVEEITTSLGISVSLDGELIQVPETVEAVETSIPVNVGLGGTLVSPPLGVPRVRGGAHLTFTLSGTLTSVTENIQSLQTGLHVVIDLDGHLDLPAIYVPPRPQGRAVSVPYRRASVSRVYKSQSQSRRF